MEDMHGLLDTVRIYRDAKSAANGGYEPGEAALLASISSKLEAARDAVDGKERGKYYTEVVELAERYILDYIPTYIPEPRWALATA